MDKLIALLLATLSLTLCVAPPVNDPALFMASCVANGPQMSPLAWDAELTATERQVACTRMAQPSAAELAEMRAAFQNREEVAETPGSVDKFYEGSLTRYEDSRRDAGQQQLLAQFAPGYQPNPTTRQLLASLKPADLGVAVAMGEDHPALAADLAIARLQTAAQSTGANAAPMLAAARGNGGGGRDVALARADPGAGGRDSATSFLELSATATATAEARMPSFEDAALWPRGTVPYCDDINPPANLARRKKVILAKSLRAMALITKKAGKYNGKNIITWQAVKCTAPGHKLKLQYTNNRGDSTPGRMGCSAGFIDEATNTYAVFPSGWWLTDFLNSISPVKVTSSSCEIRSDAAILRIAHEMLHALGFLHTQARDDRDDTLVVTGIPSTNWQMRKRSPPKYLTRGWMSFNSLEMYSTSSSDGTIVAKNKNTPAEVDIDPAIDFAQAALVIKAKTPTEKAALYTKFNQMFGAEKSWDHFDTLSIHDAYAHALYTTEIAMEKKKLDAARKKAAPKPPKVPKVPAIKAPNVPTGGTKPSKPVKTKEGLTAVVVDPKRDINLKLVATPKSDLPAAIAAPPLVPVKA